MCFCLSGQSVLRQRPQQPVFTAQTVRKLYSAGLVSAQPVACGTEAAAWEKIRRIHCAKQSYIWRVDVRVTDDEIEVARLVAAVKWLYPMQREGGCRVRGMAAQPPLLNSKR